MRRTLPLLVIALLSLTVPHAAAQQPPDARPAPVVERIAGADRFATATAISQRSHPDGAETVLLARGDDFADALSAAALAGWMDAPLLLTATADLPAATAAEIERLEPTTVVVLGGTAAVGPAVAEALREQGRDVERIAGDSRYATAAAVARRIDGADVGIVDGRRTAFLASGTAFPDALSAGPLAHAATVPLLLTPPDRLAPEASAAVRELGIEQVVVLGGQAAVPDAVAAQIGVPTLRLAGADRTATAARIARYAADELGFGAATVVLARGDAFPDALAAGPFAGAVRAALLLTQTPQRLGTGGRDHLLGSNPGVIVGLGGQAALSTAVVEEAVRAARGITYVFPIRPASAASYGRAHHDYPATDIFAACGTAVVAPTVGRIDEVSRTDTWDPAVNDGATRGGLSVSLVGDDGVRYYGSHLASIHPEIQPGVRVQAGQPLGTVGRTGSARSTPCHLHFGISPPCGHGDWQVRRGVVAPWPYLDAWQTGEHLSAVDAVRAWREANATACP
jgi:peptidoglycan LD-endopeptidase LytH